ncbi:MAG TPA: porin [Xanthobacteraceae bacterium]|jgi:hypothetical protein
MHHRVAYAPAGAIRHGAFIAAMLAVMVPVETVAQTLTAPNPKGWSSPVAAKPEPKKQVRSCSAFGAGFVAIPGTDGCVKIGGSVTSEATARASR